MTNPNAFETPDCAQSAEFNAALELARRAHKAYGARHAAALALSAAVSMGSNRQIRRAEADFSAQNDAFRLYNAGAEALMPGRAAFDSHQTKPEIMDSAPVLSGARQTNPNYSRAEKKTDKSEVKVDILQLKEALKTQIGTTFAGYESHVEQINQTRSRAEKIQMGSEETLAAEFREWITPARLTIMARTEAADGLTYTICAVMNETVNADEILEDGRAFGNGQPYKTTVYPEVISQYTAQQISGTNPRNGKKFKFVAVPSRFAPRLYGDVNFHRDALARSQKDAPFLQAPTPLVIMSYLRTRRAMGDKLVGKNMPVKTDMVCYGMEGKAVEWERYVPRVTVHNDGKLFMYDSGVERKSVGFVLVG